MGNATLLYQTLKYMTLYLFPTVLLAFGGPQQHARKQPKASPNQSRELGAKDNMDVYSTISYTLPEGKNNKTMGTQSPTYTDERRAKNSGDHGRRFLMFHGIILRSQLIELIKNKVFFDEDAGVSDQLRRRLHYDHSFTLISISFLSFSYYSPSLRRGSPTPKSPQTILATPVYTRQLDT